MFNIYSFTPMSKVLNSSLFSPFFQLTVQIHVSREYSCWFTIHNTTKEKIGLIPFEIEIGSYICLLLLKSIKSSQVQQTKRGPSKGSWQRTLTFHVFKIDWNFFPNFKSVFQTVFYYTVEPPVDNLQKCDNLLVTLQKFLTNYINFVDLTGDKNGECFG